MEIVIDTSAVIAVLLNEPTKPKLIELTQETLLSAPNSIHWEVGNALSAMFKRKTLSLPDAKKAISHYLRLPIRPIQVDIGDAIELSHKLGLYAYDAYFISCAKKKNSPLLTLDRALINIAHKLKIRTLEV